MVEIARSKRLDAGLYSIFDLWKIEKVHLFCISGVNDIDEKS